jgi:hypothetical protein
MTDLIYACVYPLNQVLLWPIENYLDGKLKVDPKENPILKGNFAPITEE